MKITVTEKLKDYENKPLIEDENSVVLRDIFAIALNNNSSVEDQLTPELKLKVYKLTQKIFATDKVELTVDEAALIKERVGLVYTPLIYGRVCEVLDGKVTENV